MAAKPKQPPHKLSRETFFSELPSRNLKTVFTHKTSAQNCKNKNTAAATTYINHQINSIFTNKAIVHHSSDAPSTASVQKLGDTCTRVGEAEVLPICPERGNTITPNSKRRHRNCSTCRHNRLARVGIFTSEFTSQNHKFIS